MALDVILRPARLSDLAELTAIENESFPDPSWNGHDFLRYDCTVAEVDGKVAGFLVSRQTFVGALDTPPEREILNVAVGKSFRRSGVGTLLLRDEIQRRAHLFLEVRASNVAARGLYCQEGFKEISSRKRYYSNPEESAIVMELKW